MRVFVSINVRDTQASRLQFVNLRFRFRLDLVRIQKASKDARSK